MQRSKELWFPDGDLVVQVEKISFRIYAKGLAESSTVFAAMLALPQPVEGDTVDGLPVVRLFDTDADAALLLKALFDKTICSRFFQPPPARTGLLLVLDIMRMSNKYDAQKLFKRAVLHLEAVYCTSLSALLEAPHHSHMKYPKGLLAGHLSVLAAAEKFDARWILPCVYYEISCYPISDILDIGAAWDALPRTTRRDILWTHAQRLDRIRVMNQFMFADVWGCDSPQSCPYNKLDCAAILLGFIGCDGVIDPLRYWTEEERKSYRESVCEVCLEDFEKDIEKGREEVWNDLPEDFGFDGWTEVHKMREEVMGTA
ncbi:hypothetical protein C8J57DRAFT_1723743 [Mycena rebaudengoi]|nr:hypothetical protein C8J57DRAFT_1723743 [Mycena rebaudengoi]